MFTGENNSFVLRGTFVWSGGKDSLRAIADGYAVCVDGVSQGVFEKLPGEYAHLPVEDYRGRLIIPGLVDLHTHAAQNNFRGLGMDKELMDWLNDTTFPEESCIAGNMAYARGSYEKFVSELRDGATTRAVIFATADVDSTILLMDLLEEAGLATFVGKVNMDRCVPDYYVETTAGSVRKTIAWLDRIKGRYLHTRPILTPRFTVSCTDELMGALAAIQKQYHLPVQSHLSESPEEIETVKRLCPDCAFYGQTYSRFGLFGGEDCPTVMAHCVWSSKKEIELMDRQGVYIAHCPDSNINLSSGIAPIRRYLDRGMRVGLGTDVAAGASLSIFDAMRKAIQCSKLLWRYKDHSAHPITLTEAFYMATLGGGAFFGRVGSFDEGYAFDAVILDDTITPTMRPLAPAERLERIMYLADDRAVIAKYVDGRRIKTNR